VCRVLFFPRTTSYNYCNSYSIIHLYSLKEGKSARLMEFPKREKLRSAIMEPLPDLHPPLSPVTKRPPFRLNAERVIISELQRKMDYKPPPLRMRDAPERTGALILAPQLGMSTHCLFSSSSDSKGGRMSPEYKQFLADGTRTKDGSNKMDPDERFYSVFSETYMSTIKRYDLVKKLQKGVYIENKHINKLEPKALRTFGPQDRPHHIRKDKNISFY
jgi:hypothetical protein